MSATPTPPDFELVSPTMPLGRGGGHRRAEPDRTRWFMWAALAGALVAVVLATVTVMVGGGDPERSGSAPTATEAGAPPVSEPEATEATPEAPSASPSVKPSPRPTLSAAQLVARLHTTVAGLVRDGQLATDAGEELSKRLREAAEKLAAGEVDKAREKLAEFGEKVANLRKEGKLSDAGHQALAAGLTQLARVLPSR